jgi:hypothetical protein
MRLNSIWAIVGFLLLSFVSPAAHSAEQLTQSLTIDQLGLRLKYPTGWSATPDKELTWIVNAPLQEAKGQALDGLAQVFVTVEHRPDHADAVRRLRDIASEFQGPVEYLVIDGWPAMQRRLLTLKEQPGAAGADAQEQQILRITTAIAAGNLLIRAEARMPPNVGDQIEQQVREIETSLRIQTAGDAADALRAVSELRANPRLVPMSPPPSNVKPTQTPQRHGLLETPRLLLEGAHARSEQEELLSEPRTATSEDSAGAAIINGGFASEPEIAVSTDGQNIVAAQQFGYATSNDGGQTFPTAGAFPSSDGGDSSVAFGQSGAFYEGTIFQSSSALNVSTDGGKTFTFRAFAYTCPTSSTSGLPCGFTRGSSSTPFPDQEHIAADRFNAASGGGDQVYFAWRQGGGNFGVACSTDGGQTFGAAGFAAGDFPRITVGPDGFVYVVYFNTGNVTLNKYSSCQSGFAVQTGSPVTVASGLAVTCPVSGLDRCNNGNQLSSPTVAVDQTDAQHIYVSYAQSSGAGESIVVQDSVDGGKTWPSDRAVTVSASNTARRFMPWMCAVDGFAYVTWYDRRAATSAQNDLTDYYGNSAYLDESGVLNAWNEFQINAAGSSDSQCLAGKTVGSAQSWPGGSRAAGDSTTCSEQPELGGSCRHTPNSATDSFQACNLSVATNTCPVTETCQTAGGTPKYGDYNGNACAAGKLYAVWASATPPPGQTATGNVDLYFSANSVYPDSATSCQGVFEQCRVGGDCCSGSCSGRCDCLSQGAQCRGLSATQCCDHFTCVNYLGHPASAGNCNRPRPPPRCGGPPPPASSCSSPLGWQCCGADGWECGVCT